MESLISAIFSWITDHPHIAGVGIAFLAFAESLALVGFFLPGAVIMFGIGALVGAGVLELWPTLAWSAVGAIAGDGVSFWLGKHFHQRIRVMWPFSRYPELIARSTDFFHHHGAKSIVFARFIGPLRPIVPAVAGMLDMPSRKFLVVNVISGIFWAPVYVIPGMIFTASLGIAAEVATRLAVMIGLIFALVLIMIWLARKLFRLIHPHTLMIIHRMLEWSRLHPVAGQIPATLLDPEHPEARGLTLMGLLLITAALLFALLLPALGADIVTNADSYTLHTLQTLRTPWIDRLMVAITQLGDSALLAPLFLTLFIWLIWKQRRAAAAHWAGATLFALALVQTIQWGSHALRADELTPAMDAFSFPSGHSTLSAVVYGFLAVLITREVRSSWHWPIYGLFAALIGAIAFSRLYLGVHGLSDVTGGLFLGMVWVALLGIAYRRHPAATLPLSGLIVMATLTIAAAYSWHFQRHFEEDLQRYAVKIDYRTMARSDWWEAGWRTLPAYRNDLRGWKSQPLSIQYAGDLKFLESELLARGWKQPIEVSATNWLQWYNTTTPAHLQPLLPQLHDGRSESLLLIGRDYVNNRLLALRLWESSIHLSPGDIPLWIGNISYLAVPEGASLKLPRVQPNFEEAFIDFIPEVKGFPHRVSTSGKERGATLLIENMLLE